MAIWEVIEWLVWIGIAALYFAAVIKVLNAVKGWPVRY
jgi:hypothetical protein